MPNIQLGEIEMDGFKRTHGNLTGHESLSMIQRYAHLVPEFKEAAIRARDTRPGGLHDKSRHDLVTPENRQTLQMIANY